MPGALVLCEADGGCFADPRDVPCRNLMIYGRCRYEDTCAYNHDVNKSPEL